MKGFAIWSLTVQGMVDTVCHGRLDSFGDDPLLESTLEPLNIIVLV